MLTLNAGTRTALLTHFAHAFDSELKGDLTDDSDTVLHQPTALCDPRSLSILLNAVVYIINLFSQNVKSIFDFLSLFSVGYSSEPHIINS